MDVLGSAETVAAPLIELYKDLHAHPELSHEEHRTAGIVAERLAAIGVEVIAGIGSTGVAGVLRNGDGPTVLLRADMDALPVLEQTGLDYASTARGIDPDGLDVPLMHACGHDVHITSLLGATQLLAENTDAWNGTVVVVFQPAEEHGGGAQVMIDDGLYERVPRPDVVLGQHVVPLPAGTLGAHPGPAFSATDAFEIRLFGRGGHGSQPEKTIDPVVMAASTVMRLQTVVSREVSGKDTAVVTVGTMHAGTKNNIIGDEATLGVNVRSYTEPVRDRVIEAVHRIVRAEAAASGAVRDPEFTHLDSFPVLYNDPDATERTHAAFRAVFGEEAVVDPGALTGSEDVGILATAIDVPIVYWLLGGIDAELYAAAAERGTLDTDVPSNHSPFFAPVIDPTLRNGIAALTVASLEWLKG